MLKNGLSRLLVSCISFLLLMGVAQSFIWAAVENDITIVYNVGLRHFSYWYKGKPIDIRREISLHPREICLHPFEEQTYFHKGQTIYLQFEGATIGDLFTVELAVDALAEPTIPIYGAIGDLPKIQWINLAETLLTSGEPVRDLKEIGGVDIANYLYNNLDQLDTAALQKYLDANLINPSEVGQSIKKLDEKYNKNGTLFIETDKLKTDLTKTYDELEFIKKTYKELERIKANADKPSIEKFADCLHDFANSISKLNFINEKLSLLGIMSDAKNIISYLADSDFYELNKINVDSFGKFIDSYEKCFPEDCRFQSIKGIVKRNGSYSAASIKDYKQDQKFLEKISAPIGSNKINDDSLKKLQDNLLLLADQWESIITAYSNLSEFQKQYKNTSLSIFQYQELLNEIGVLCLNSADSANYIAKNMPLPEPYDHIVLGQWFGSKNVAVTVNQGTRFISYQIKNVANSDPGNDDTGLPTSTQVAQVEPVAVAKTKFQIHNQYHFQLAAGFMASTMQDIRYSEIDQTVTEGSSSRAEKYFIKERDRHYRFLPTIDIVYYPWARDFFPWKARYSNEQKSPFYKNIGFLLGFSLVDPTKDFFFGATWMSSSGIGIKGGVHIGLVKALPDGVELGKPIVDPVVIQKEKVDWGLFVGISMSMQLFKDIFFVILK